MLNSDEFIKRLLHLTEYYGLSAAVFADKIGVQRSSISHLLSGRNKPSLDFVLKILDVFPEVNLYWFLNGKGDFLKSENQNILPKVAPVLIPPTPLELKKDEPILNLFDTVDVPETDKKQFENVNIPSNSNPIFKVIIFYQDGTFRDFHY